MRNFNDYAERAIQRYGLAGNNALARELGVNKSSISQMFAGKIYPAEATMIKLAELAGMPKEEALIDLNLWRSKDKPELQKIWQNLAKILGCAFFFYIFLWTKDANAALPFQHQELSENKLIIYVMYTLKRIKIWFIKQLTKIKEIIFFNKKTFAKINFCY